MRILERFIGCLEAIVLKYDGDNAKLEQEILAIAGGGKTLASFCKVQVRLWHTDEGDKTMLWIFDFSYQTHFCGELKLGDWVMPCGWEHIAHYNEVYTIPNFEKTRIYNPTQVQDIYPKDEFVWVLEN
jgi:hypothetical protein